MLAFWANILETVHAITNVCVKQINEVIYVYLVTFKIFVTFKCLINVT